MQPGGGAARTQAEVAEAAGRRHGQLQRNVRPLVSFCVFGRVRRPESLDKVTVTDRPGGQNCVLQEYKSRDSEIACTDPEGYVSHIRLCLLVHTSATVCIVIMHRRYMM